MANGEVDTLNSSPWRASTAPCPPASAPRPPAARAVTATSSGGPRATCAETAARGRLRPPAHHAGRASCRALTGPININNDHSDAMGARDAGWTQMLFAGDEPGGLRQLPPGHAHRGAPGRTPAHHGVPGRLHHLPRQSRTSSCWKTRRSSPSWASIQPAHCAAEAMASPHGRGRLTPRPLYYMEAKAAAGPGHGGRQARDPRRGQAHSAALTGRTYGLLGDLHAWTTRRRPSSLIRLLRRHRPGVRVDELRRPWAPKVGP